MKKYPAFRFIDHMTGLDPCLESWFEHFVDLGQPVAIIEEKATLSCHFSVWVIGEEAQGGDSKGEGNKDIMRGRIVREANDFSVILASELNNQKLDKQREE